MADYGGRPGEMRLNVASLVILREATRVTSPAAAASFDQGLLGVHDAYRAGKSSQIAKDFNKTLDGLEKDFAKRDFSAKDQSALLVSLLKYGATSPHLPYEIAEQVTMGASSILSALSADGSKNKAEMDALYGALRDPDTFKPEEFTAACQKFVAAV